MTLHSTTAPAPSVAPDHQEPVRSWSRFAPLTGVAFFVLLVASAVTAGETPTAHASGATVLRLFTAHAGAEKLSNLLASIAVVFLLFFAGYLSSHFRRGDAGPFAAAALGGAVLLAAGGATRAGVGWALADGHDKLEPGTAQTLNVLFATEYPTIVGIATLMFASWLAIVRTRALPQWLGWAALVIALVAVGPPTLIPLIAAGLWISVAGILLTVQSSTQANSPLTSRVA